MTDPRPKPRYGEYAPPGWVSPVPPPEQQQEGEQQAHGQRPQSAPSGVGRRRTWDVFLTVTLLVIGALQVSNAFTTFGNLPQFLNQYYESQGVGQYTNVELAQAIGVAIMVSQAVIFLATAWVSYLALKHKRLAFYWPLIGFGAAMIVTVVLMIVVMVGDPALMTHIQQQTPQP